MYNDWKRKPNQRYIFRQMEPPEKMWRNHINQNYFSRYAFLNQVFQIHRFKQIYLFFSRNFFNWTWTYRSDSDLTKAGGPRGFIVKDLDQPKPPG